MDCDLEEIRVDAIDSADDIFRVTAGTGQGLSALVESIDTVGILAPPLVQEKDNQRFRIVCGFRRVAACARLGTEHLPVLKVAADTPHDSLIFAAVTDNAAVRPLSVMEQATSVRKLRRGRPWDERLPLISRALGIDNVSHLKNLESLCDLPPAVQDGLWAGTIAYPTGLFLKDLGVREAEALAGLLNRLGCNTNRQRRIVEQAFEIARHQGEGIGAVVHDPQIRSVLSDEAADRPEQTRRVLDILYKKRYPRLSAATQAFDQAVAGLDLPKNVTWEGPRFFETRTHTLAIRFEKVSDLEKNKDIIKDILAKDSLRLILDP